MGGSCYRLVVPGARLAAYLSFAFGCAYNFVINYHCQECFADRVNVTIWRVTRLHGALFGGIPKRGACETRDKVKWKCGRALNDATCCSITPSSVRHSCRSDFRSAFCMAGDLRSPEVPRASSNHDRSARVRARIASTVSTHLSRTDAHTCRAPPYLEIARQKSSCTRPVRLPGFCCLFFVSK